MAGHHFVAFVASDRAVGGNGPVDFTHQVHESSIAVIQFPVQSEFSRKDQIAEAFGGLRYGFRKVGLHAVEFDDDHFPLDVGIVRFDLFQGVHRFPDRHIHEDAPVPEKVFTDLRHGKSDGKTSAGDDVVKGQLHSAVVETRQLAGFDVHGRHDQARFFRAIELFRIDEIRECFPQKRCVVEAAVFQPGERGHEEEFRFQAIHAGIGKEGKVPFGEAVCGPGGKAGPGAIGKGRPGYA